MPKQIQNLKEYIILGVIFLFPLVFSNTFIDQVQLPKLIILVFGICLVVLLIALEIFMTGKFSYGVSKFDLPVFLLVAAYLASAIFVTPNKVEAFFSPGVATLVVGFGVLYFFVNLTQNKNRVKNTLIASAAVLSAITLASFLGLFDKISFLPAFVRSTSFNATGDYLSGIILLIATIPLGINFLIKEKKTEGKLAYAFSTAIIFVGLGISLFTIFPLNKSNFPVLPPLGVSWSVAIETIKESPVLGIGAGNYLTAFNRFRPVTYNSTNLWQLRFSSGRDLYLTVLTETGLFGAIALILLIFTILKILEKSVTIYKESHSLTLDMLSVAMLSILLIVVAVFPASPTTLMLIFVLIAINSKSTMKIISFSSANSTPKVLLALALVGLIGFFLFKAEPIVQAEYVFKQAYDALNANDGKKTYALLGQAINTDPYVDRYHASFAQVNLAIARSVVTSKKDPKDLTDSDKNTISQLIQQSIREGQATVALNPTRAANWQVLANIYQAIIPYAAQADQFAEQSYNQAILLDPIDPNSRISLGGVYYSLGKYSDAVSVLQLAVLAKPDLANAHYNLALAYQGDNQIDNAISEINNVISLVPNGSPDYTLAKSVLDNLQKKKTTPTPNATESGSLTTPQINKPANPQLNLPPDSSPPAAPKLPTTTPTATPSTSPSPVVTATPSH